MMNEYVRPKKRRGLTIAERLDRYTKQEGECRVWMAARDRNGYGRIRVEGSTKFTHRVAWSEKHGPIPAGMDVCHHCDNPPCREESHLFLGTRSDNMTDMLKKGRAPKKLTEEDVSAILGTAGTLTAVAAQYGVSHALVGQIKRGEIWKHVFKRAAALPAMANG